MMDVTVLTEALPYIHLWQGKTFVVKYGGAAMVDEQLKAMVMQDIVLLVAVGVNVVLVHGGGKDVSARLKQMGIEPEFYKGLRVSHAATMEVVEMVLTGTTNKGIVSLVHAAGGKAVGLSGKDGNLLIAEKLSPDGTDIGFVGEVTKVNPEVLTVLTAAGYLPVVSTVAIGLDGNSYNVNADHAAGAIAAALGAEKLITMTDVAGYYQDKDDPSTLVSQMSLAEAKQIVTSGQAGSGMGPKLESCVMALEGGVKSAHIIDGRVPHAILGEVFTIGGVGTMLCA